MEDWVNVAVKKVNDFTTEVLEIYVPWQGGRMGSPEATKRLEDAVMTVREAILESKLSIRGQ
jgi:hypothetical protein